MKLLKKGLSSLEYIILMIIIMGALVATGYYIKRGIQGRWRTTIDSMGEQYDPTSMSSHLNHALVSESLTVITTQEDAGGYWTRRDDFTNATETKSGFSGAGWY